MTNEFTVIPYKAVGPIEFGMKKADVEALFDTAPTYVDENKGITDMRWGNISVKINKKGVVQEVAFIKGEKKVFYNGIELLTDSHLDKTLGKLEEPGERLGFKVYFSVGMAITGFSGFEDDKAINIFSQGLKAWWKKFVEKK